MTEARKLLELADRVEKLTEACRETDRAIALATGWIESAMNRHWLTSPTGEKDYAPRYTASLDAAMTLVPEGWHTDLVTEDRHSHSWLWDLRGGFGLQRGSRAARPALALTAASLRARAQGEG